MKAEFNSTKNYNFWNIKRESPQMNGKQRQYSSQTTVHVAFNYFKKQKALRVIQNFCMTFPIVFAKQFLIKPSVVK